MWSILLWKLSCWNIDHYYLPIPPCTVTHFVILTIIFLTKSVTKKYSKFAGKNAIMRFKCFEQPYQNLIARINIIGNFYQHLISMKRVMTIYANLIFLDNYIKRKKIKHLSSSFLAKHYTYILQFCIDTLIADPKIKYLFQVNPFRRRVIMFIIQWYNSLIRVFFNSMKTNLLKNKYFLTFT